MISRHMEGVIINKNIEKGVEQRDKNIERQGGWGGGGVSDNTYILEEITSYNSDLQMGGIWFPREDFKI